MKAFYKVLRAIDMAEQGLTYKKLKVRYPFLDIASLLERLSSLGYISNKITGYKVLRKKQKTIEHNYDKNWYSTDLGKAALDQYLEQKGTSPFLRNLLIVTAAAACIIYILIFWSGCNH